MSDFKITPEDVGRVAINALGDPVEIFGGDQFEYAGRSKFGLCIYQDDGYPVADDRNFSALTHWKPRTLKAPKRWWNVYVRPDGVLAAGDMYSHEHGSFNSALEHEINKFGNPPIARVYAEHWHGCEEGRFDTPETIDE